MIELSNIGIFTVFAAGLISFLSPCVLPLVPAYVSYTTGQSELGGAVTKSMTRRLAALGLSSCFVLGFSTIFILMGASATGAGQLLLSYRYELNIVGGIIVIIFGLFMLGIHRPVWMERELRFHFDILGGRPLSAYVLGLAFAFGWTPCIGPILGAILTMNAGSATVSEGVTLLAIYSLGLGTPFMAIAMFAGETTRKLKALRHTGRYLQILAGGVMILMGVGMITGRLAEFSYWLLEVFPILGTIG
jgi:cytochrome c-type biogenesis protein